MRTINTTKTAIALARTASNATSTDAERNVATSKLAAYVAKHNLVLADVIARAAQPDLGKTPLDIIAIVQRATAKTAKSAPKARTNARAKPSASPEKPSKPADLDRNAAFAERIKLISDLRTAVSGIYNGPSLAVRTNPKRFNASIYADLLANPKHRTDLARLSTRDNSALALIITRGSNAGAFDPVQLNLDSGIFSRLCSVGFIQYINNSFTLTADALTHARKAVRQAA